MINVSFSGTQRNDASGARTRNPRPRVKHLTTEEPRSLSSFDYLFIILDQGQLLKMSPAAILLPLLTKPAYSEGPPSARSETPFKWRFADRPMVACF